MPALPSSSHERHLTPCYTPPQAHHNDHEATTYYAHPIGVVLFIQSDVTVGEMKRLRFGVDVVRPYSLLNNGKLRQRRLVLSYLSVFSVRYWIMTTFG